MADEYLVWWGAMEENDGFWCACVHRGNGMCDTPTATGYSTPQEALDALVEHEQKPARRQAELAKIEVLRQEVNDGN